MSTQQLLEIVKRRGLQIVLVDGRPVLRGERNAATPRLLAVLKRHRERIVDLLAPKLNLFTGDDGTDGPYR